MATIAEGSRTFIRQVFVSDCEPLDSSDALMDQ